MKKLALLWVFLFSVSGLASSHYMWILAFQDRLLNLPRNSHCFALFVGLDGNSVEEFSVLSWMPKSLEVRLWKPMEEGSNLTIHKSLQIARDQGLKVAKFGPFEIQGELFRRSVERRNFLESGKIKYKCVPGDLRPEVATNCIHSISDLYVEDGLLDTGRLRGIAAAKSLVEHLRPWIIGMDTQDKVEALVSNALDLPAPFSK